MRTSPSVLVRHTLAPVHLIPHAAPRIATSDVGEMKKTADVRKSGTDKILT
jgi:hypothetical protein